MRLVVTGSDTAWGEELATGQLARGHQVARAVGHGFADVDELSGALERAAATLDGVDAIVHVGRVNPDRALLADMAEATWEADAEAEILSTLYVLQVGHRMFEGRGGRVVVVVPTIAFTGASGYAAVAAAAEGQRTLVKAAARQWGAAGICVAGLGLALPGDDTLLGSARRAVPGADPGDALAFLCSEGAIACTGQTLIADGGTWMGV